MDYLRQPPQKYLMDGTKLLWYPERLKKFINGERFAPITLDIGIHKGCNIRCKFCYGVKQKLSSDYIPTEKLLSVARDAGKAEVKGIAIVGDGEPTLNPGLYPFVQELTKCGVASAVATNGLLLDKEKIDILTDNCSWIRFNISAVRDRYGDIHKGAGNGAYKRLVDIIRYTVEHKKDCTIGLQMVLIPECFDQVLPLTRLGISLGVDYVQIKQFSDAGAGMPMHFDMAEYELVEGVLKAAESMSSEKTAIKVKWGAMKESKSITKDKKWGFDWCIDLPFLFQISGNGKCYPCGYLFNNEKYCYGDLIKQSLWDILNSDRYWNIIEEIAETPMAELCKGQCRHSCSDRFMDRFVKAYRGSVENTLTRMCGSEKQYKLLRDHPPDHLSFI